MTATIPRAAEDADRIISSRARLRTQLVRLTATAAAFLLVTILSIERSSAAFITYTPSSSGFETGTVDITDDDAGSALFEAVDISPSSTVVECLTVTYLGTWTPASIRLHASAVGDLAPYLTATIEIGRGGAFGDCAGFAPDATVYTGTLGDLAATHADFPSGLPTFTAISTPADRTFRFTIGVDGDNAAQGRSALVDLVFEVQEG